MIPRSGVRSVTVAEDEGEQRLDRWFKRHFPSLTHGRLEKLLRTGQVRLDGRRVAAGARLVAGQVIRVPPQAQPGEPARRQPPKARPADAAFIRARVLYSDDWLVAIDKPPGLAVQGGTGIGRHVDAMLGALSDGGERPRLVHRLDKDTSGVLVLARTAAAARFLTAAFRERRVRKTYWAVTVGVPKPAQGRIDLALEKRAEGDYERVVAATGGQKAITYYRVLDSAPPRAALVALLPLTGRTHQLRVHLAAIGMPILGDGKYGGAAARPDGVPGNGRLHLHARALVVPMPDGGTLRLTAEPPPHIGETFAFFGFDTGQGDDPFADLELPA